MAEQASAQSSPPACPSGAAFQLSPLRMLSTVLILAFTAVTWFLYTNAYLTDDAVFYLVTARNLGVNGEHTFSGVYPHNGFHPLWQYMLAGYARVCAWCKPNLLSHTYYAVPLALACMAWGAWCFGRIADAWKLPRLLVVDVPLAIIVTLGVLCFESHIFYALLGCLLLMSLTKPLDTTGRAVALGFVAGLVFLSRLDAMFFIAAYGVWYMLQVRRLKPVLCFGLTCAALAVPYVISNMVFFGSPMPVSGWTKSSFPHLYLRGLEWINSPPGLSYSFGRCSIYFGIVPTVFALLVLLFARRIDPKARQLMWVLWIGAVMHLAYIALFTRNFTGTYNYYVITIVLGGLAAGIAANELRAVAGWCTTSMPTWMRWTCAAATVAFLLAFVAVNVKRRWSVQENPEQHPAIAFLNKHNIHKTTILVADRPGFLAFDSDNYIVCADMLTGNRPLLDKMRAGANGAQVLMDHCAAQGRPIEYVIVFGIPFLELSKDERTIALLDPKTFPDRAVIGEIQLTTPKIPTAGEVPGGERIKVWKMPAKAVSGS